MDNGVQSHSTWKAKYCGIILAPDRTGKPNLVMTISEIKNQLKVNQLNFKNQLDEEGDPTSWYKAWDNTSRTMVVAHENVLQQINRDFNKLSLKDEGLVESQGSGIPYRKVILVIYSDVDYSY